MSTSDLAVLLGISPLSRFVSGYAGATRTIDDADAVWNWEVLHPEMKRRHVALYFSDPRTVKIGVDDDGLPILVSPLGSGAAGRGAGFELVANFWSRNSRTYLEGRPSRNTPEGRAWLKPGYAPIAYPGGSNHEEDTFEGHAMAVDNVGWEDGWMGRNVHRFGLKTFWDVGSEPWHTQPAGYGNSKSALQADLAQRGLQLISLPSIPHAHVSAPVPLPPPIVIPPTTPKEQDEDVQIRYTAKNRDGQFLIGSGIPLLLTPDIVQNEPFKSIPKIVGEGADEEARWDEYLAIYEAAQVSPS